MVSVIFSSDLPLALGLTLDEWMIVKSCSKFDKMNVRWISSKIIFSSIRVLRLKSAWRRFF